MPLYEFYCKKCDKDFEETCSFEKASKVKCPDCGKIAEKLLSVPAISFKGTGFYCTDSRGLSTTETKTLESDTKPADSGSCTGCGVSKGKIKRS